MAIRDRLEAALQGEKPLEYLRGVLQELVEQGYDRSALTQQLELLRNDLHAAARDEDEDIVLEVLDFLVGWCSPHMSIGPGVDATRDGVS